MQMSTAYWSSQVLLTANRIGLFEKTAAKAMSSAAIAEALGTDPRATELLLKTCVSLGLLERESDGYRNSALSEAFLVPGNPAYMGNAIRYSDNLYATWGALEQALRDGTPPMPAETYLGEDAAQTRDFVYGMHDRALGIARCLVELVDLSACTNLLDVGGGPGTYSALLTQRFPQLRAQVLELPGVASIAKGILAQMGAADRVSLLSGSYVDTVFPTGVDAVLLSGVFHRETPGFCRELIERASDVLEPGGQLMLSDVFADAGGMSPPFATLFGLNMMLTAPDGGVHADEDVAGWMREVGFENARISAFPPPLPHRVITGSKT